MNVPAPLFYLAPGQAGTKKAPVMTGAFFVLVGTYFSAGAGAGAAGGGPSAAAGFLGLNSSGASLLSSVIISSVRSFFPDEYTTAPKLLFFDLLINKERYVKETNINKRLDDKLRPNLLLFGRLNCL